MPMERAVPLTVLMADSNLVVLRSGSFFSAISLIWSSVIVAATSRPGLLAPDLRLSVCLISSETGGSLRTKSKVRSS